MTYTAEQLREWLRNDSDDCPTKYDLLRYLLDWKDRVEKAGGEEVMDKYDELCERLEDWKLSPANLPLCKEAIAAIRELKARLEIDPRHSIDGIAARDETIRMLEGRLAAIEAAQSEDVQKCVDYVRHEAGDRRAAGYDGSAGMFEKIAALLESLAAKVAELFEEVAALTEERDWYSTANERAERAEAALAECRSKLEADPRTKYDGIDCRDETIRMLESKLAEREAELGRYMIANNTLSERAEKAEAELERLKDEREGNTRQFRRLQDRLAQSEADASSLAAGQCIVTNGGLMGDDHGHLYCDMQRQRDELRGRIRVMADIMSSALDVMKTVEGDGSEEDEALMNIRAKMASAIDYVARRDYPKGGHMTTDRSTPRADLVAETTGEIYQLARQLERELAEAQARAADRDRYAQGMANWKAAAEAKDKQLAEAREEAERNRKAGWEAGMREAASICKAKAEWITGRQDGPQEELSNVIVRHHASAHLAAHDAILAAIGEGK